MKQGIDIIKLGGSVITDKTTYKKLNEKSLIELLRVLKEWKTPYILIHGAGSYGHILAERYSIKYGYKNDAQIEGLLQIRQDMNDLTTMIIKNMRKLDIRGMGFQTSAICVTDDVKQSITCNFSAIEHALNLKIVPVLSGDISFDEKKQFTILSGDKLIGELAKTLSVNRVLFLTDVDGLLKTTNEKTFDIIPLIYKEEIMDWKTEDTGKTKKVDVTGQMIGKLHQIKQMINFVDKIYILNGTISKRMKSINEGKETICTLIQSSTES